VFLDFKANFKGVLLVVKNTNGKPKRNIQREWAAKEDAIMLLEIDKSLKKSGKSKFNERLDSSQHWV
jgi:hypothetical protein